MSGLTSVELLEEIPINTALPPSQSLMQQFEKMIVTTLLRSFALDFMIKDQDGGNVDTPLTAREYGLKDKEAVQRYEDRGEYNSHTYHKNKNYISRNTEASALQQKGQLYDAYTGRKIALNEEYDLDHTIAAVTIHKDPAVYLANLNGEDLANADTNLNHTNRSINRSKKEKNMSDYVNILESRQATYDSRINELKAKDSLSDKERGELNKLTNLRKTNAEMMKDADDKARKAYNKTITQAYLRDSKTYMNLGKESLKSGLKMGARQVLGIVLAEVWAIAREKFPVIIAKMKEQFSIKEFLVQMADTFKEAFQRVKEKFKTLIESFKDGLLAGILSSISTFIINFFTGTAKNIVKMIREFWGSVTEVFKLLVLNPDQLAPGELIRQVSKVIVMAAAVMAGTYVGEMIDKTAIAATPVIGEAIKIFLSGLTTGVISISLVYFIDHSKEVEKLVQFLNTFADQLDRKKAHYEQLNEKLKQKVSELAELPLNQLNDQIHRISIMTSQMKLATTEEELNSIVSSMAKEMKLKLPYENRAGLEQFMENKNLVLHFK